MFEKEKEDQSRYIYIEFSNLERIFWGRVQVLFLSEFFYITCPAQYLRNPNANDYWKKKPNDYDNTKAVQFN